MKFTKSTLFNSLKEQCSIIVVLICLPFLATFSQTNDKTPIAGTTQLRSVSFHDQIDAIDSTVSYIKSNRNSFTLLEFTESKFNYRYIYKNHSEYQLIVLNTIDTNQQLKSVRNVFFDKTKVIYTEQVITNTETNRILNSEYTYLIDEKLVAWVQMGDEIDTKSEKFKTGAAEMKIFILKLKEENYIH